MLTVQLQNKTCVIDAKENLEQILIFNATGEKAIFDILETKSITKRYIF
jgi:hypothetical protein